MPRATNKAAPRRSALGPPDPSAAGARLAALWSELSALPPPERLGALDRFAESYGTAILQGEIDPAAIPPAVIRDLVKFRRLVARDQARSPAEAPDRPEECLTVAEWDECVAPALRSYREARALETTSAAPDRGP